MTTPPSNPSILVATCGNDMACDDAFGPMVARALRDMTSPTAFPGQVVNLATKPGALLDHLPGDPAYGLDLLFIVDAAQTEEKEAGHLIDLDWFSSQRPPLVHDSVISSHGLTIGDDLELANRMDMLPKQVRLVAVTIGSTRVGGSMRHVVRVQVAEAAKRIYEYTTAWLCRQHHENS